MVYVFISALQYSKYSDLIKAYFSDYVEHLITRVC